MGAKDTRMKILGVGFIDCVCMLCGKAIDHIIGQDIFFWPKGESKARNMVLNKY